MASILVTGCEEDGADQSANVASGLTFPRPPCAHSVLADISARVYTSQGGGGGRSSEKSRLTCLARVRGHPHPSTPPPTRDATLRTSAHVIVRDVISTTTRDEDAISTSAYSLRATKISMHLLLVRTCEHLILSRGLHRARDATGDRLISCYRLLFSCLQIITNVRFGELAKS